MIIKFSFHSLFVNSFLQKAAFGFSPLTPPSKRSSRKRRDEERFEKFSIRWRFNKAENFFAKSTKTLFNLKWILQFVAQILSFKVSRTDWTVRKIFPRGTCPVSSYRIQLKLIDIREISGKASKELFSARRRKKSIRHTKNSFWAFRLFKQSPIRFGVVNRIAAAV